MVNGHINPLIALTRADVTYHQKPLLLRNNGKGIFTDMQDAAGTPFQHAYVARGLAVGDIDNDGDTDAVFVCLNEKPVLLQNNVGSESPWIGFQLEGTVSNRDAIGARLTVRIGNRELVRWINPGGSFLSSNDKRVVFGLGGVPRPERVSIEIRWPSGLVQSISGLEPGRYHHILEPGARAARAVHRR